MNAPGALPVATIVLPSGGKGSPIVIALAGVGAVAFPPDATANTVAEAIRKYVTVMRIAWYIPGLPVSSPRVQQDSRPWGCAWVALVVLSWTAPASAQADAASPHLETGREWLARCSALAEREPAAAPQSAGNGRCLGWVEGLIDVNEIYRGLGALDKTTEGFCVPADATVQQAAKAITAYLDEHATVLHFSARILAYMALRRAFPCGASPSVSTSGGPTVSIP